MCETSYVSYNVDTNLRDDACSLVPIAGKGRISLIAKKPKMAVYTLIAMLLIIEAAVGCTFTRSGNNVGETNDPARMQEIRFEAGGDIPNTVKDYALELVERELSYYTEDCGYTITDAKISALTRISTGTASLTTDIQMWRLEYRLLPEDPNSVMLAGGMQMEGSWITEWGSVGQPYLLLVHNFETDAWQRICMTNTDIITQDYGTPEMLNRYGNAFTAAAMELHNAWQVAEMLGDDVYNENLIYELFDSGDSMDVALVIEGDMAYNTYTVKSRWYAGRYDVLMSSYIWTLLENSDIPAGLTNLWMDAPYYITVESEENDTSFTFFADSDKICYHTGGTVAWYSLTYKYDGNAFLAAAMRAEYDNLDVNFENISFFYESAPENVAELFVREIYGTHLLNLAPGGGYSITDYQVVDWGVTEVSEDKTAVVGWFEYAVIPENFHSPGLLAGNTTEGTGELEGWLVMYRQFVLQKQSDGYWYCIDLGSGGVILPE